MDNLCKTTLSKHPNIMLQVQHIVHDTVYDVVPVEDIEREVRLDLAYQLARELVDKKSVLFSMKSTETYDVTYQMTVYALSPRELVEVLQDAFQAGVDSTKST